MSQITSPCIPYMEYRGLFCKSLVFIIVSIYASKNKDRGKSTDDIPIIENEHED